MIREISARPWYRYPMVWIVIAPPLGSVIAGIVTMVLILMHPDPDVRTPRFAALAHPHAAPATAPATATATATADAKHASNSVVPPVD